ncbi:MAG: hypothetical protein ACW98D_21135 [Promethearchaeota archaeon]|jgi:putative GTP pyrophosphokinase
MVKKVEKLQEIYTDHFPLWQQCLRKTSRKIGHLLNKEGLKYSLKSRIKTIESLNKKQNQLQQQKGADNEQVKDLLGLRVVVPFHEDVERIINLLENKLIILETERKSENLSYREFAYDSVHLIAAIEGNNNFTVPIGCLKGCEIQIRTILQDAWAEVEHELIYKSSVGFPNELIRKKLAALNASLTLSDIIFQEIKDFQRELESWGKERFKELKKQAMQIHPGKLPKYIRKKSRAVKKKTGSGVPRTDANKLESIFLEALEAHNNKEYKKAINLYSQALQLNPDLKIRSIMYNHRGMAYFMLNLERQALQDFEMSFQCNSTNYRALNNRALILRRMGQISEALEDFSKSIELKEYQPEVYYLRAQTNFEIGDYKNSIKDLKFALKIHPQYNEAQELLNIVKKKMKNASKNSQDT